jgi:hypothetical protein
MKIFHIGYKTSLYIDGTCADKEKSTIKVCAPDFESALKKARSKVSRDHHAFKPYTIKGDGGEPLECQDKDFEILSCSILEEADI